MTNMMTLREAGQALGLAAATLRRQAANGSLRAERIGNQWVVTPKEVERYRRFNKGQHDRLEKRPVRHKREARQRREGKVAAAD